MIVGSKGKSLQKWSPTRTFNPKEKGRMIIILKKYDSSTPKHNNNTEVKV